MEAAFFDGAAEKRPFVLGPGEKRLAAEQGRERLETAPAFGLVQGAGKTEKRCEIGFEKLFRNRARALPIKPPSRAVGENSPTELASGQIVHPSKIAEHLGRRHRFLPAEVRSAVERTPPALGFDNGAAEFVAFPLPGETVGARLRGGIGEQQAIGHVFAPAGAEILLTQPVCPAEQCEDRPNQVILGLRFVRRGTCRKLREDAAKIVFERRKGSGVEPPPFRRFGNGLQQKIAGEQASPKRRFDIHR